MAYESQIIKHMDRLIYNNNSKTFLMTLSGVLLFLGVCKIVNFYLQKLSMFDYKAWSASGHYPPTHCGSVWAAVSGGPAQRQ